jgi:membrane-associated phospholipid phosphatase
VLAFQARLRQYQHQRQHQHQDQHQQALVPTHVTPPTSTAHLPWLRQMQQRLGNRWLLKFLGVSGFMWLFFEGYFHTLRAPVHAVQVMPLTWLDHAVVFQPYALGAYVSLWVYVALPAALMINLRALVVYGLWVGALSLTGLLCFYLWPTAVPPHNTLIDIARHPGFALLQGVDAAGNACPSLHVATAVFSALWLQRLLQVLHTPVWLRVGNAVWVLLIVYSTLAIKQHVAWDVLAGTLLGAVFAWASLRWFPPRLLR